MKTVYKKYFPVCFLTKDLLLVEKKLSFYILDLNNGEKKKLIKLHLSGKARIINQIPLFSRIFRGGIRSGIKVSEKIVLFVVNKTIYELDIENKQISNGYSTSDRSRPLVFSKIFNINGFQDGIYFGGYKGNPNKEPISIYQRIKTDQWEEVYQFPYNAIEHIHNIIADPYKNIIYILTGDFDNSAGIWIAENGFKNVFPLLTGKQEYRGCVGFPTPVGLVYATDSPFLKNSLRLLKCNNRIGDTEHIMDINGPCIYGCQWGNDFVFSTSVEGDGRNTSIWNILFGNKRGQGIIENASFIYKGNLIDGFNEIYKVKKDILPFIPFQFGVLIFPSGLNESTYLPVYHVSTLKNNMNTILIK